MNWRDGAKNLMFFTEMFWRRNIRSFEEHIGYYSTKFALILRHLSSGFIWSWKLFHVYWFTCILECCSQSSVSSSLPISPLITRHVEVIQSQFFFLQRVIQGGSVFTQLRCGHGLPQTSDCLHTPLEHPSTDVNSAQRQFVSAVCSVLIFSSTAEFAL